MDLDKIETLKLVVNDGGQAPKQFWVTTVEEGQRTFSEKYPDEASVEASILDISTGATKLNKPIGETTWFTPE